MPEFEFVLKKDIAVVTRLVQSVQDRHYQLHPENFVPYDYEACLPWVSNLLQAPNLICVLIKREENFIGYALIDHQTKSPIHPLLQPKRSLFFIDQMSIEPEYQNRGLGKVLFNYIYQLAVEKKVDRIQLSVWSANEQAKSFYQKLGFQTIRETMEYNISNH